MRASSHIQLKERKQLTLENFKGVDFSSSPLRVHSNRASNMQNFINEYGVNRKRNGWNELFRIEDENGNAQPINGIFQFIKGNRKDLLVHAGKRIYKITKEKGEYSYEDITLSSTYSPAKVDPSVLTNTRSQAFVNQGKCYIIGCGDYLVWGSWNEGETYELRRVVNNEDTYIPTTTISIDDDSVSDDTRGNLDDVNLLSSLRKNQLLGRAFKEGETSLTWTLDSGKVDEGSDLLIVLETMDGGSSVTYTIENNSSDKTKLFKTKRDDERVAAEECGSVNYATGQITLTLDSTPQMEGRDNITVTFECAVEGYAERITQCQFGILFGVDGNTDRLFLSGNPNYPNIDFHSEMDDYTYFGDLNTASMGSDSVAIGGYARLSDSTLVIYKQENSQEASIFYRTGTYSKEYDSAGNIDSIRGIFPTSAGSIGEGIMSRYACVNFGGDNIILSRNGIFGIVLAENVATTERYARERSRSINEKLTRHENLSEAVGIVYKNRYYLSLDDVCYIADSRFKYTSEDDIDGSYNYEWWYWTNIPVRVWAIVDNELCFGTRDGQVCVFDNEYTDRTHQTSQPGDLSLDLLNNRITYNSHIRVDLAENDIITFSTSGIYALALRDFTVKDNKIYVTEEEIVNLTEGTEVYADNVEGSGLSLNTKYLFHEIDKGACCFGLIDDEGNEVEIKGEGFRLCKYISQKTLYLSNITESTFQLKEYKSGEVLTLTNYNGSLPTSIMAKVTHRENVVAEWYTPIFDLGTNESSKTLLKMTISTNPEINGKLSFGYETRSVNKLINAKGINVFSFDNFSFENFSFETGFANSYSVKCKERNFNFIIFRFVSDNDSDCIVNTFTVLYKINKSNKGVE